MTTLFIIMLKQSSFGPIILNNNNMFTYYKINKLYNISHFGNKYT